MKRHFIEDQVFRRFSVNGSYGAVTALN